MDWAKALEQLPFKLAVTDRKGRVLLKSGEHAGLRQGRSFLKIASEADMVTVGRAAKRALADGTPRTLASVASADQEPMSVRLIPFAADGAELDHLLVMIGPPEPTPLVRGGRTPAPAPPRAHVESHTTTPDTSDTRTAAPIPKPPAASELVIVAAGGTVPLARSLETVLKGRVKARAWPVARFVDALGQRTGGDTDPAGVDENLDPATRLLFLGDSPYLDEARRAAVHQGPGGRRTGWAVGGQRVLRGAVWAEELSEAGAADHLGDLQFETMEIVRRAMPIARKGRAVDVAPGLKLAAAFLEQPAAMDVPGDAVAQVRHHQHVLAVARFLIDGLDLLIGE